MACVLVHKMDSLYNEDNSLKRGSFDALYKKWTGA